MGVDPNPFKFLRVQVRTQILLNFKDPIGSLLIHSSGFGPGTDPNNLRNFLAKGVDPNLLNS